jgi:hypothetical protein
VEFFRGVFFNFFGVGWMSGRREKAKRHAMFGTQNNFGLKIATAGINFGNGIVNAAKVARAAKAQRALVNTVKAQKALRAAKVTAAANALRAAANLRAQKLTSQGTPRPMTPRGVGRQNPTNARRFALSRAVYGDMSLSPELGRAERTIIPQQPSRNARSGDFKRLKRRVTEVATQSKKTAEDLTAFHTALLEKLEAFNEGSLSKQEFANSLKPTGELGKRFEKIEKDITVQTLVNRYRKEDVSRRISGVMSYFRRRNVSLNAQVNDVERILQRTIEDLNRVGSSAKEVHKLPKRLREIGRRINAVQRALAIQGQRNAETESIVEKQGNLLKSFDRNLDVLFEFKNKTIQSVRRMKKTIGFLAASVLGLGLGVGIGGTKMVGYTRVVSQEAQQAKIEAAKSSKAAQDAIAQLDSYKKVISAFDPATLEREAKSRQLMQEEVRKAMVELQTIRSEISAEQKARAEDVKARTQQTAQLVGQVKGFADSLTLLTTRLNAIEKTGTSAGTNVDLSGITKILEVHRKELEALKSTPENPKFGQLQTNLNELKTRLDNLPKSATPTTGPAASELDAVKKELGDLLRRMELQEKSGIRFKP